MSAFALKKWTRNMHNKWIPVTEELPPMDTEVLVYCVQQPYKRTLVGFLDSGCKTWFCETDNFLERIKPTHWLPIPKAPKGEE